MDYKIRTQKISNSKFVEFVVSCTMPVCQKHINQKEGSGQKPTAFWSGSAQRQENASSGTAEESGEKNSLSKCSPETKE